MTASIKIRQLESKISDLQTQHQLLLKERQQEIAVLLSVVDLTHFNDKTLVGALFFIKDKITTQDPILEAWRAAGEKFLRQHKARSSYRQAHAERKEPERFPKTPDEKVRPSKQTHTPLATDQLPQESSKPGKA